MVHVRSLIAGEITDRIGLGILNTPEEDEDAQEVKLLSVHSGDVRIIFHDGTTVMDIEPDNSGLTI